MKLIFLLNLLFSYSAHSLAGELSDNQLDLLRQGFCKKINGQYKLNGVAPYAWELSTLVQVSAHSASTRFARSYNTTLALAGKSGTYQKDHQQNLELQRRFIKEFFNESVFDSKLSDDHFKSSVTGDISNTRVPVFTFTKHSLKISCTLEQEGKAKPCDFSTLTVVDKTGHQYSLCTIDLPTH